MAIRKVRVRKRCFVKGRLWEPGDTFDFDGPPGSAFIEPEPEKSKRGRPRKIVEDAVPESVPESDETTETDL